MNLPDLKGAIWRAWQVAPHGTRVAVALLAYLMVISVMGMAAALISLEIPFFDLVPTFK
jgi:hypothetical protein